LQASLTLSPRSERNIVNRVKESNSLQLPIYHDVKPIRVLLLQLLPLRLGVLPVQLDILVPCLELPRDLRFDALVRRDDHPRRAVQLEQLREDEARGARAEDQRLDADAGVELVHAVNGTRGGLGERGLLVREVVDLVDLLCSAVAMSSVSMPRYCVEEKEYLTRRSIRRSRPRSSHPCRGSSRRAGSGLCDSRNTTHTTAALSCLLCLPRRHSVAERTYSNTGISDASVTFGEALDVFSKLCDHPYYFVPWNQLSKIIVSCYGDITRYRTKTLTGNLLINSPS
jgi:hypothetical protein